MARVLSKKGYDNILRRIYETGGLTADMERDLNNLRSDFDERAGILNKYGETYDGEEDMYDWIPKSDETNQNINDSDLMWKTKYETSQAEINGWKKRYMDRFFGTDEIKEDYNEVDESQKEDIDRDGTEQTIDDLFVKREG